MFYNWIKFIYSITVYSISFIMINLKIILKFLKRKLVLYIKEAVFSNINIILDEKNLGNWFM